VVALWVLADDDSNRVRIAAAGAIPLLTDLLAANNEVARGSAAWARHDLAIALAGAVGNLALDNPANTIAIAAAGAISPLVTLVCHLDHYGRDETAKALTILAQDNADNQERIKRAGGVAALKKCRVDGSQSEITEAAKQCLLVLGEM
jgi:hypothetical protein